MADRLLVRPRCRARYDWYDEATRCRRRCWHRGKAHLSDVRSSRISWSRDCGWLRWHSARLRHRLLRAEVHVVVHTPNTGLAPYDLRLVVAYDPTSTATSTPDLNTRASIYYRSDALARGPTPWSNYRGHRP